MVTFGIEESSAGRVEAAARGMTQSHGFAGRQLRADDVRRGAVRQRFCG
jgi:hypothetical protein